MGEESAARKGFKNAFGHPQGMARKVTRAPLDPERALLRLVAVMAFLGVLLSIYLLKEHWVPTGTSFCDFSNKLSCDIVNKSEYAEIGGIPLSLFGIVYWAGVLLVALVPGLFQRLVAVGDRKFLWRLFTGYLLLGFAFSMYLTSIEAFILKVWCPLCIVSAVFVTVSLGIVAWLAKRQEETI